MTDTGEKRNKQVDIIKCFYSLLNTVGGSMVIKAETLSKIPDNLPMTFEYIQQSDSYRITTPVSRQQKRRITREVLKPSRKLFLPGSN